MLREMSPRIFPRLLLVLALAASAVFACSVPVFRYALEHWASDPFQVTVFHRGPLTDAQQALVRELRPEGLAGRLHANLSVRTVDLTNQASDHPLPWLTVATPSIPNLWSAPLTDASIRQLLDSPARREITQRLTDGESAVWLLLDSSDREKDTAAAEVLTTRLEYLMGTLELPKLDAQDITNGLVSVGQDGLKLQFSVLRLSRDDPQEAAFTQMLLASEPDLKDAHVPIVFPVFGRGRALYALVGAGIKRETIDEAATFLIGKCSCQIKEQNPGLDLLLSADWDALVKVPATSLPDLPTLAALAKAAPVAVTISGTDAPKTRPSYVIVALAIAALLAAGILWQRAK
jgi:hypothetical protein